ncbi:DUF1642 domain-containing protein [Listeria monocytogenes]|uniref:DUF1642 domain-containing protein n=1 Tax=Listeria monocytogenes TaxID=1639 RepID=UPI00083CDE16|nr:DUF1642 domain-containing protein [Listeria monocytogenes]AQP89275.1 hypothetical protein B0X20_12070 [Listeria monocytogenes]ATP77030.1 hypothetical protein A7B02_02910 [Listeria monocytogenes]EAC4338439.1 DUF1642 domain-containing protein [Listeria monocytogenes]EAC6330492.1 DUF1642 domain-containing protein [Listeria monocytogenes]EAC6342215.1 DUF1642 domain-containing protein [Listeria monocytogenes]
MKFREGDKVEFVWLGKLTQGVVTEIRENNHGISYKIEHGEKGETILITQKGLIAPARVLKVPQFADDWIKHCKQREYDLACLLDYEDSDMSAEMYEWLISSADNQELLARAWFDGYEVEEEPLYYVRLPLSTWNDDAAELEVINMYVLLNKQSDETTFTGLIINKNKKWTTKLTEAEIKGMPEGDIYWRFAVLVEEVEGES